MAKEKQLPLLGNISDKLDRFLQVINKKQIENKFYDESSKKVDLTKIVSSDDLERVLQTTTDYSKGDSATLFEKFFDIALGRVDRYSEYENIVYRIPEAAQALQIYVDSILAPDIGDTNKHLVIDTTRDSSITNQAKLLIEVIFKRSNFYKMLPQIVYTSLLYGDAFLELEPTSDGIRYILHPSKNCSLVYDKRTDIELGLMVKTYETESLLKDVLTQIYPDTYIEVPEKIISIVSNKTLLVNNKFTTDSIERQLTELLKDIYKDEGSKFRFLAPHRYIRFPIFYNNNYYPYGTSILDSVRSIAKQLLLIEAALAIYRATRTPLRSMWTLDVTGTEFNKIPGMLRRAQEKVRRQKILQADKGSTLSIDSIPEIMGEQDDIWTVQRNDKKLISVENLPVPDLQPYTNDADYFRKKLLSALGIPPSYLAEEEGASTKALLTLEDVRFSRTIKRYQSDFNDSLQELTNLCFILLKKPEFCDQVTVTLPPLISIEANMKAENLSARLQTANEFSGAYPNIPKLWIMKNIVGFTDDEIKDMEDSIDDQKKFDIFADQQFGKEEGEEGPSGGGFGGGFSGGFDEGGFDEGLDFGNEEMDSGGLDFGEPSGGDFTSGNAPMETINTEMSDLNI